MRLLLQSRSLKGPASRKMGKSIDSLFLSFDEPASFFCSSYFSFPTPGRITARVLPQVATTHGLFLGKCSPPHFYAYRMVLTT